METTEVPNWWGTMTSLGGYVDPIISEVMWTCRRHLGWHGHMGCVQHVSKFWTFGVLKSQLEHDTWPLPDWTTCLLPIFYHVATYHAVWRLGTLEGKYVTCCVGSKTAEGQSTYWPLIPKETRWLQVKASWEKAQEEIFETSKSWRSEAIHNQWYVGGHPSTDHELWVKIFWEEESEESWDSRRIESRSGSRSWKHEDRWAGLGWKFWSPKAMDKCFFSYAQGHGRSHMQIES